MIIKVCGMRSPGNIRAVEALGPDMMGFIFYEKSPRFIEKVPDYLPEGPERTGVFVNHSTAAVLEKAGQFGLTWVQLHGQESPEQCREIKEAGLKVIKAFSIASEADIERTGLYEGSCDLFLFDTKTEGVGGSGRTFDWTLLDGYKGRTPFLLSGGIGPDTDLSRFRHPMLAGYDLNSRFETGPAMKDTERLRTFIKRHRQMNRIDRLFGSNAKDILSIYFCAGAPDADNTAKVIRSLQANGVDMIEVGIPFSDPMADGPVIQDAATKALKNGMTLGKLFSQLAGIRKDVDIPLILMGYLNPVFRYGFEEFCKSCKEVGIDGMIIPDLPFKDYLEKYKAIAESYDLRMIMLITPETSEERVRLIDEHTGGFIYMVSSASTTGAQKDFNEAKQAYFRKINSMGLRIPRMVGFGISNKQTFDAACQNASGGIIGSKFVSLLDEYQGDADKAIKELKQMIGR